MELGLIYSDANSIPPGQDAFPMTGYCVADCTNKLPDSGIYIFASQLHAHLTGRKLWTSHYRNGMSQNNVYPRKYSPFILLPLRYTGTRTRTGWVSELGYSVRPRCYMPGLSKGLEPPTARRRSYNIKYNLPIHKKYQLVEWNDNNIHSLRELYSVSPLNVACLQHDGSPFQNHLLNWTSVSLPHVYSGPYNKERQSYECAALND
uniref:Cu2_monoox_C domain-containing protein n=1 Tax=Heterorhabditis bacteriophora TaxID=37862 RepID=A0A1I7X4G3_HETBA